MYLTIDTSSKNDDKRAVSFTMELVLHNFSMYMFDNIEQHEIYAEHIDEDIVQSYHFYTYLPNDEYSNDRF